LKFIETLIVQKDNVLKELDSEKGKTSSLNKEKDDLKATIQKGSILSCFNITAKGVKFKNGGKKESETNKASRVQKIKVSFSLGENKIAKSGEKTVYVRILTPDGKERAKNYDEDKTKEVSSESDKEDDENTTPTPQQTVDPAFVKKINANLKRRSDVFPEETPAPTIKMSFDFGTDKALKLK
jgi:hypothetical protein